MHACIDPYVDRHRSLPSPCQRTESDGALSHTARTLATGFHDCGNGFCLTRHWRENPPSVQLSTSPDPVREANGTTACCNRCGCRENRREVVSNL